MLNLSKKSFVHQTLAFVTSFALIFLTTSNKTFLAAFFLSGLIFFFILKKNFFDTLVCLLLLSLPFEVPLRYWNIVVTPQVFSNVPTSGYTIYIGITLKIIFALLTFLILFRQELASRQLSQNKTVGALLLSFFLIVCINCIFFYTPDIITFHGLYRLWQAVLMFFIGQRMVSTKEYRATAIAFIISLSIFTGIMGSIQTISQRPLGRFIELIPSFSESGYNTGTDGPTQNRISGYISHPVYFGSFVSIIIPIILALTVFFIKKNKNKLAAVSGSSLTLCIVSSLGTLSRTVWINLLVVLLFFLPEIKDYIFRTKLKIPFRLLPFLFAITLVPAIFLSSSFITRLQSIPLILTNNGNASIRIELIKQSLPMILNNPISGVGPNRFTEELVKQNFSKNIYGFIVVVHNTILIIFTELGIPAGLTFLAFLVYILASSHQYVEHSIIALGCWVGAITFIVSSQFHPLFNQDPTFEFFMLVLGVISVWPTQKEKN